jgi:hypothetical protein
MDLVDIGTNLQNKRNYVTKLLNAENTETSCPRMEAKIYIDSY